MKRSFGFKIFKNLPISAFEHSFALRFRPPVMKTEHQTDDRPPISTQRPTGAKRLARAALAVLAVGCALVAVVRLSDPQSSWVSAAVQTPASAEATVAPEVKAAEADARQAGPPPDDAAVWADRLAAVDRLRQALQSKRNEILRIRQDYHYGIIELEDDVKRLMKRSRIESFPQAMKNPEIEPLLRNIQRRQTYLEALEKPLDWIEGASEDLLYLKRRAELDLLVKDVAEGLDLQRQLIGIDRALETHQPSPVRLAIEPSAAAAPALEAIGKRLIEQARLPGWSAGDRRDREIEAEICEGNLSRTAELSTLSLKGARCLAESDAKHLFLNRVAEMSPLVAERLSQWPGEWLCLNGIARLDPQAATHLFAWRGQWLSLNGLGELSDESGRRLAAWSGQQLELMGLRPAAAVGHLAQWEAAGGRLFVTDAIRSAITQTVRK